MQAKLTRHFKLKHADKDKVKSAQSMPKKEQNKCFELLRKEGIYNYNMKMIKQGKSLMKEREQGNDGLKICGICQAFISRSLFSDIENSVNRNIPFQKTNRTKLLTRT